MKKTSNFPLYPYLRDASYELGSVKSNFFCLMKAGFLLLILSVYFGLKNAQAADHYPSFKEMMMDPSLTSGRDYRIETKDLATDVFSIAIHGGVIEPKTDVLAQRFAERFSLSSYIFRSFFRGPGGDHSNYLHVTATHFDDPSLLLVAKKSRYCVSFHGQKAAGRVLCVGGANQSLRKDFYFSLLNSGLITQAQIQVDANPFGKGWDLKHCSALSGMNSENVVNRCQKQGIQLEMSRSLLDLLTLSGGEKSQQLFFDALSEALLKPVNYGSEIPKPAVAVY